MLTNQIQTRHTQKTHIKEQCLKIIPIIALVVALVFMLTGTGFISTAYHTHCNGTTLSNLNITSVTNLTQLVTNSTEATIGAITCCPTSKINLMSLITCVIYVCLVFPIILVLILKRDYNNKLMKVLNHLFERPVSVSSLGISGYLRKLYAKCLALLMALSCVIATLILACYYIKCLIADCTLMTVLGFSSQLLALLICAAICLFVLFTIVILPKLSHHVTQLVVELHQLVET